MITVHHLNNSRSQRVLWLLEELGLEYRIEYYERDPVTMLAPPKLKEVHPLGRSPVLEDGNLKLAESAAILEYLLDAYGKGRLRPTAGNAEARLYTFWMHYAEGSAMPPLLLSLVFSKMESAPAPFFIKPILKTIANKARSTFISNELKTHFDFVENELRQRTWLTGEDFTAADIQMSFPLEAAAKRVPGMEGRPKILSFVKRIRERPAYQRALERGGPYEL